MCARDEGKTEALKMCVGGKDMIGGGVGGERDRVKGCKYTQLYKKGIKKTQNKPM